MILERYKTKIARESKKKNESTFGRVPWFYVACSKYVSTYDVYIYKGIYKQLKPWSSPFPVYI